MRKSLSGLIRRIARNERGTSTIELALVAPMVGLLTLGVIDTSMGFAAKLELESAAARTIEKATTQGLTGSSYDYLKAEAATAAGVSQDNVTVDFWLECDGTRQSTFSGTCTASQQIARYVTVMISGTFVPLFDYGPLAALYGGQSMGSSVAIRGDAAVRIQ